MNIVETESEPWEMWWNHSEVSKCLVWCHMGGESINMKFKPGGLSQGRIPGTGNENKKKKTGDILKELWIDWGQKEKGTTEDEMAGWHHWFDGRESEWTPGVGDGQGGLACCNSWVRKESDTTERLNWTELNWTESIYYSKETVSYIIAAQHSNNYI